MITIKRIHVKNFRSLVDETIELSDYNFFVGKNDSGKSNVLKALNLFFNDRTDFNTPYDFDSDYSKFAKRGAKQAREKQIDVESIGFDAKHIAESGHPVVRESAVRWIEESLFSVDVWDGRYTRFFSKQGAAYVDNAGNFIRTAYPESEFTENVRKAIEVMTDVED